jgi:hypothetical protein
MVGMGSPIYPKGLALVFNDKSFKAIPNYFLYPTTVITVIVIKIVIDRFVHSLKPHSSQIDNPFKACKAFHFS